MTATLEILPYGLFRYRLLQRTTQLDAETVEFRSPQSYILFSCCAQPQLRLIAECLNLTDFIALASTDRRRACLAMALWERERSPKVIAAPAKDLMQNDKQAARYSTIPVFRYLDPRHVRQLYAVWVCCRICCNLTVSVVYLS
jgi:hypothetical protein